MKALDIECPACHAGPKESCRDVGIGDEARSSKRGPHVSRVRRAHYMTVGERMANNTRNKGVGR